MLICHGKPFFGIFFSGSACHLYFDLEYSITLNPRVDPLKLLDIFIQVHVLYSEFIFGTDMIFMYFSFCSMSVVS